jgi:uncharacterized membrane protein
MNPTPPTNDEKDTGRVDAFSDGVFAIVITLLTFSLRVPPAEEGDAVGLLTLLAQEWPSYLAFVTSFSIIGIMWVNHHQMFKHIARVDNRLLYYNLLLLFGISFLPFPTALVAQYIGHPDEKAAAVIYSVTAFVIALFFTLVWRYASTQSHLLMSSADQAYIDGINKAYKFGPAGYTLAIVLAFINVPLSLVVHLVMAAFFTRPIKRETG